MSSKVVMNVGQCFPDHLSIKKLFDKLGVELEKIDIPEEVIKLLKENKNKYALVLINRKIDLDYSNGIDLIKKIKNDPDIKDIPVMLVSNYKEAQEEAVRYGALYGFGKAELDNEETKEKILNALNLKIV
ncbi:MAG: transcriptional regulator [Leptospiraceae bacterium]|nr:MAG: transcriptional regulator [Leptospiraceae bacterium]